MKKEIPWSSVGYLTYKRTYSRKLVEHEDAPTEEFEDTVERVIRSCREQLDVGFTSDEEDSLRYYMLSLKGSVAGRFLWQMGTSTVDRIGLASLQNCAFTVIDEPITPFTWCMDMLALGAGVGYNLQRKHVDKIPEVRTWFQTPTRFDDGGADFIVPDSREGWVRLLGKTLKAAFYSQKPEKGTFTFSTQVIRGKGKPIKGFGGEASGPEDLVKGIARIGRVLEKRRGKKLRPIDCLDLMNIIGAIIVAGNVRRSAQLAIGDPDDIEFLLAKRWDLGTIPPWRSMSNNSVACDDLSDLHEYFWDGYAGKGEPYGLINLPLSRSEGRLGDKSRPDPKIEGYNPCAEQGLEDYETCCLAEIFLPNIESMDEFLELAILLYKVCKHSLTMSCHHPETESVVHKNMRMGIGLSGIVQASEEQLSWASDVYDCLVAFDRQYSAEKGIRPSIKLTTVKPSGTLSLLPGVPPGIHPGYARYMLRRISIAAEHPLVQVCRDSGYPTEFKRESDGTEDYGTVIVSFPYSYPEGTLLAENTSALKQLELIKRLQTDWSDNSVSCTVYYTPEELPGIRAYLEENYKNCHKSLSFLLHTGHGFEQAPYEEITEEEYLALVEKTELITSIDNAIDLGIDDDCVSGVCPTR